MIKDKNDTVRRIHSDSVFFGDFRFLSCRYLTAKRNFKMLSLLFMI